MRPCITLLTSVIGIYRNLRKVQELVFTPIHDGQPAYIHRPSKKMRTWLKKARPITLEDLQKIMQQSTQPPDPSTISICNKSPS